MAGGRPSKYSEELVKEICKRIAQGENLLFICADENMPCRDTVYQWLNDNKEFSDIYARARELRADSRFDEIDQILSEPMENIVDVQKAKLKIDAKKWQMSKEAPKKYGEYKQVDANVTTVKRPDQMTEEELRMFLGNSENS